ncbi:peroxiredoxin-like family protein [Terasakiella sp. A23]|uniref:peroxiredoxin-like family protein n=1 Tax=Terasakiella sp. FCG-A23 TaxID=3080561 RepID=UPI002952B802|nr:peroxiredoxin-like family protein [Terasakiella sp. A23]MDV7341192.1 peroxiredoxin-like family protein [Terasakiella sp. A23]
MITPRTEVPNFSVDLLSGGSWSLADQKPENFTMVVAYRGYHCPLCKMYLGKLNRIAEDLKEKGINLIVLSSDTEERAQMAKDEWELDKLDIAYGLSIEDARKLGLFVSASIGTTSTGVVEPDLFSEPGLFMIRPDQTLYFADIQTMPFLRPDLSGLLANLDFILSKGYPARGEA